MSNLKFPLLELKRGSAYDLTHTPQQKPKGTPLKLGIQNSDTAAVASV